MGRHAHRRCAAKDGQYRTLDARDWPRSGAWSGLEPLQIATKATASPRRPGDNARSKGKGVNGGYDGRLFSIAWARRRAEHLVQADLALNQENPMQVLLAQREIWRRDPHQPEESAHRHAVGAGACRSACSSTMPTTTSNISMGCVRSSANSMITVDGALSAEDPRAAAGRLPSGMFEDYFPYLMSAIDSKMARWAKFASTGETIEMVEETWTLAAEMVCKALFDREMPFNPHFIFGQVKTYTDVMNHKSIRLKKMHGELDGDHRRGYREGHGDLGRDPRDRDRRQHRRPSRQDAAEDARGGRGRSELPRIRSPAGGR